MPIEPIVIKRKGGESLPQKLYRTNKKFREDWDDFTETLENGKSVGYKAGLKEGARRERRVGIQLAAEFAGTFDPVINYPFRFEDVILCKFNLRRGSPRLKARAKKGKKP